MHAHLAYSYEHPPQAPGNGPRIALSPTIPDSGRCVSNRRFACLASRFTPLAPVLMTPNDTLPRADARPAEHRWLVAHLIDAMCTEKRLLDELRRLTHLQREAVAAADHASLDDATFGMQRVLQTLNEAGRRSRMITSQLGGPSNMPLAEVVESLGLDPSPELLDAWNGLRESSQLIDAELHGNRALLGDALANQP